MATTCMHLGFRMNLNVMKKVILAVCGSSLIAIGSAHAANKDENIEVTPLQQVTQQELAAIYVLSEVCPSLVSDQSQFENGYNTLAKEYLPQQKNPTEYLKSLSKEKKFKPLLAEAQADAKKAGKAKNQEICKELSTYSK
jgi:hypothetical protein